VSLEAIATTLGLLLGLLALRRWVLPRVGAPS
jgi:hypothetical protein